MSRMEWNDNMSVGLETADTHHKKLVSMVNSLHEAMLKGETKDVLAKILHALIVYTEKHFEYEEGLFKANNYPDFQAHKQEHDELTAQVKALNEEFNAGRVSLSIEVMTFLKNWLTEHIMDSDMKAGKYLNDKGVH